MVIQILSLIWPSSSFVLCYHALWHIPTLVNFKLVPYWWKVIWHTYENPKICKYYNPEIPVILRKNHGWSLQWYLEEKLWLLNTQLYITLNKARTVNVCIVLIWARHCFKYYAYFHYSWNPVRINPVLQIRKLRLREVDFLKVTKSGFQHRWSNCTAHSFNHCSLLPQINPSP